jgi:hypothetical protein
MKWICFLLILTNLHIARASQDSEEVSVGSGSTVSLEEPLKRPDAKFNLKPIEGGNVVAVGKIGDLDAEQFRQIAVELHASLKKKYPEGLTPIDLDVFQSTLDANVVFVDGEISVNGNPRVAANIPSANMIIVNRKLWRQQNDPRMQVMVVFHEYLGLRGLDLDGEISSYFLTHSVLPGIIISVVMYQTNDVSKRIDTDENRITCYRNQLKNYGDFLLEGPAYTRQERIQMMEALRQFDKFFLISKDNLTSTIIYKKYMRIDDLDTFLGVRRRSDGTLDKASTMKSRGYDVYFNFCAVIRHDYHVSPGSRAFAACRQLYLNYLPVVQLVPECRGIMKGFDDSVRPMSIK